MKKPAFHFNLLITAASWILLCCLMACNSGGSKSELNKIDSLIVINDSIGVELDKVDTSHVKSSRAAFAENWKVIEPLIDSLSDPEKVRHDSMWSFIMAYENKDRIVKRLMKHYHQMITINSINRQQLSSLKVSIRNRTIPSDSVEEYISREGEEVMNLRNEMLLFSNDLQVSLLALDSLAQSAPQAVEYYKTLLFRQHLSKTNLRGQKRK
jgi:hypothetical protein